MEIFVTASLSISVFYSAGADLGGGCRGCEPPLPEMTCGFLIQLVFCKKKTMWFIGVEVEQETIEPPPKKILDPPLLRDMFWLVNLRKLVRSLTVSNKIFEYSFKPFCSEF